MIENIIIYFLYFVKVYCIIEYMQKFEAISVPSLEDEFRDLITQLVEGEPETGKYRDQNIAIQNPDLSSEDLLAATGSENINFISIGVIGYGNDTTTKDYYINFIENTDRYTLSTAFMLDQTKFGCVTEGSTHEYEDVDTDNKLKLIDELVGDPREMKKPEESPNSDKAQQHIRVISDYSIVTAPEDPERFKAALRLLDEIIEKDSHLN